jgi:hypothetical protein
MKNYLWPLQKLIFFGSFMALLAIVPARGWANSSVLQFIYTNNFQSYATGSYPISSNPLPGWTGMTSQSGLQPAIVSPPVNASGNALNLNSTGGGATGYLSVNSPLLAGTTSDWSVSGSARYLASNHTPWYGNGGLLLSSTGDMSGNFLWLAIETGWGEFNPTTTWARPYAQWSLGGSTGQGTLFSPTVDNNGAIRMSTDTWGPALLTASRTAGASSVSYALESSVDGLRTSVLTFSGAAATALDSLQYVGFANYLSSWQYDDLSVKGLSTATALAIPEPSSVALLGLGALGLLLHRRRTA